MQYQYQVDYGSGYEDVFPDEPRAAGRGDEENPARWLAGIEAEITARRARVLLAGNVVEERDFTCKVTQNSMLSDGSAEFSVQCSGGSITVIRKSDGEISGEVQSGFAGDAGGAVERAIEAVKKLNTK